MISWPLVIERACRPQACLEYICIALFWQTAGNYQQLLALTRLHFLIFPFSHSVRLLPLRSPGDPYAYSQSFIPIDQDQDMH